MSRATKHTVKETIEQLFEDEDGIPDYASDSEIEGDFDEEYNDILISKVQCYPKQLQLMVLIHLYKMFPQHQL